MKSNQKKFTKIFLLVAVLLFASPVLIENLLNAQTKNDYKILEVKTEIGEGKDKEVKVLFEGERRKIAQLILRNGKRLDSHSAEEPIFIQCIDGAGELLIKRDEVEEKVELLPGKNVTLEGNVIHDVIAKPSISILLIRFLSTDTEP